MSGMAVGATGDPDRGKFRIHVKGGHKAGAKDTAVPRQITPDEAVHRRRVLDKVTKPVLRRPRARSANAWQVAALSKITKQPVSPPWVRLQAQC